MLEGLAEPGRISKLWLSGCAPFPIFRPPFHRAKQTTQIDTQSMRVFITEIYTPLQFSIIQAISLQTFAEREGEIIDQTCLREVVIMLNGLGNASENTEKPMKLLCDEMAQTTEEYYAAKARMWLAENSCSEYLLKAKTALLDEWKRLQAYFTPSLEPPYCILPCTN